MAKINMSEGSPWDKGYEDANRNPKAQPTPFKHGFKPGTQEWEDYVVGFGDRRAASVVRGEENEPN